MKKQTIFFDFDGTILNSFSLYFKTTKYLNSEITEKEYRDIFLFENFTDSPLLMHQNYNEFFNLISAHAHLYELFPGVQETLQKLSEGYNLVIITACPKNIVKFQLSRFRLPQFQKIYGFEKAGTKGEKIKSYCAKNEIQENNCFFVTDTVGDLLQVKGNSVKKIALTYGFSSKEQLKWANPDFLFTQFSEIEKVT